MKSIAEALEVSRCNLIDQKKDKPARPLRYDKMSDDKLLVEIRAVIDQRASYGYRRVHALLNHKFAGTNEAKVNHKRVYRIMKERGLLLERHTGKSKRTHEGKVITIRSNLRWCSDTLQIRCWNGEKVEVAFALDCCDREAIAWVATTSAITGEMIRDLMVESTEKRFGRVDHLPEKIQWLSDNGGCYTADETRSLGASLGFEVCNTPAYSPESNGMAESFVKSFKRDYVYLNDLKSAQSVLEKLAGWFADYNENAPHKGLKMKSPNQYRREILLTS